jgi:hypothetical protein
VIPRLCSSAFDLLLVVADHDDQDDTPSFPPKNLDNSDDESDNGKYEVELDAWGGVDAPDDPMYVLLVELSYLN